LIYGNLRLCKLAATLVVLEARAIVKRCQNQAVKEVILCRRFTVSWGRGKKQGCHKKSEL